MNHGGRKSAYVLKREKAEEVANYLSELPKYELRDLMCDVVGVNHMTTKDELLTAIGKKL